MRGNKFLAAVLAAFLTVASVPFMATPASAASVTFTDISGHWSASIVNEAAQRGLVSGYQQYDGTYMYKPDNLMTRQEFFKLVVNVLSVQPDTTGVDVTKFCDVLPNEWYADTVAKAVAAGITNGTTTLEKDGYASFGIGLMITRQEAAKIVASVLDPDKELTYDTMMAGQAKYDSIGDKDKIAVWAAEYVQKIFVRGYMQGDNSGNFNPTQALSRAEAATLLLNVVKNESKILGPKQAGGAVTTGAAITSEAAVTTGSATEQTEKRAVSLDSILKVPEVSFTSVAVSGSTVGCKSEHSATGGAFTMGRGTKSDPYVIENEEQLNHIREHIGEAAYFILANDINVKSDFAPETKDRNASAWSEGNWIAIGTKAKPFDGYLDGNGYYIKGLDVKTSEQYSGLIGYMNKNGAIVNLTIKASDINGGMYSGSIVGFNAGYIENCLVDSTVFVKAKSYVGGIAGYSTVPITKCQNKGSVTGEMIGAGGIAGYMMLDGTVKGCINEGSISGSQKVGGIVGHISASGDGSATIEQCINLGTISSSGYNAGGILGTTDSNKSDVTVTDCANKGTISGNAVNGGILGATDADTIVKYCYNLSKVSGSGAGGIAGTNSGNVSLCMNDGDISGTSYAGGIVGSQIDKSVMTQCYNDGYVYSDNRAGGITGKNEYRIRNCYNTGKVESKRYAGGIAGDNGSTLNYCYTVGIIKGDMAGELVGLNAGTISYCFWASDNGSVAINQKESPTVAAPTKSIGLTKAQLRGTNTIDFSATEKYTLIELLNSAAGKTIWEEQSGWQYPGLVGFERV